MIWISAGARLIGSAGILGQRHGPNAIQGRKCALSPPGVRDGVEQNSAMHLAPEAGLKDTAWGEQSCEKQKSSSRYLHDMGATIPLCSKLPGKWSSYSRPSSSRNPEPREDDIALGKFEMLLASCGLESPPSGKKQRIPSNWAINIPTSPPSVPGRTHFT